MSLVIIIIMGFFFSRISALAVKVAMGIGIISYIIINYLVKFDFYFFYVLVCTFCINVVVMLVIGFIKSRVTSFIFKDAFAVDMKSWKNVKIALIGILFAMIGVYVGLVEFGGYGTRWLAMISYFIVVVVIVYLIFDSWRYRYDLVVIFIFDGKDSLWNVLIFCSLWSIFRLLIWSVVIAVNRWIRKILIVWRRKVFVLISFIFVYRFVRLYGSDYLSVFTLISSVRGLITSR